MKGSYGDMLVAAQGNDPIGVHDFVEVETTGWNMAALDGIAPQIAILEFMRNRPETNAFGAHFVWACKNIEEVKDGNSREITCL